MPYDIEYLLLSVFGKLVNQDKTSENPVKSILLSNSSFSQKKCFWEEKSPEIRFWEIQSVFGNIFGKILPHFGKIKCFWEVLPHSGNCQISGGAAMRKKGYKGRCEKKDLSKCQEVCRTYDAIQSNYADILQNDNDIQEIRCNVLLDGLSDGAYTSDFVCVKADGDLMVRECVFRKFLTKPMTVKLLDASRDYWLNHGVSDWGMVIDEE